MRKDTLSITLAVAFTTALTWSIISSGAGVLTFEGYKRQVAGQNLAYRAGVMQVNSFQDRMEEASSDFIPNLIGGVTYTDDRSVKPSPLLYGYNTISEVAYLGVQTKLRTGTTVGLTYNVSYTQTYGSGFQTTTIPYVAAPVLSVTQSLWRDFNAGLSKANEEMKQSTLRAQAFQQRFINQQLMFNTETAYWRLALTRQLVKFDQEAIERTGKILKWSQRRVSMNVADRSDSLQSEAALKQRQFQYQTDLEQLRQTSMVFNSLRNVKGDLVPEELVPLDQEIESKVTQNIAKLAMRYETQAALQNAQSQKAQAKAGKEALKPDISVLGSVQLNGRGGDLGYAAGESWNGDNPTYSAGLRLTVPLDFALISHVNQGYNSASMAADLLAQRAQFDLEQDWNDIQKTLKDAVLRLSMARDLEKIQGEKLNHERGRFNTGRTTNFQVLQFEDHFSDAHTTKLRIQNEIITVYAKALLYNNGGPL